MNNHCEICRGGWRTDPNQKWYNTTEKKPEENRLLIVIDSGGQERKLKFYKNMFWLADMSMYIYFTPDKWRYAK